LWFFLGGIFIGVPKLVTLWRDFLALSLMSQIIGSLSSTIVLARAYALDATTCHALA